MSWQPITGTPTDSGCLSLPSCLTSDYAPDSPLIRLFGAGFIGFPFPNIHGFASESYCCLKMRYSLTLFLLTILFLTGCAGAASIAENSSVATAPREVPSAGNKAAAPQSPLRRPIPSAIGLSSGFQAAIENGTRTTTGEPGPAYWQQETSYQLTARLYPDEKRLEGAGRIIYTNHSPDALHILSLELAQNLHKQGSVRNEPAEITGGITLQRVSVNGQSLSSSSPTGARYAVSSTQLTIIPSQPVLPETSVEIEIDWSFAIPQAGASGRMGYSRDDILYLAYWYPVMSVYDDVEGWVADPFLGQSEFYYGFGDYDVTVELPSGWIVAATGELLNPEAVLSAAVVERMREAHASDLPVSVVEPEDWTEAVTLSGESGRLQWLFSALNVRDFAFSATRGTHWDAARAAVGDRNGDGSPDYAKINTFYRPTAPRWKNVTGFQQHALSFLSEYTGYSYPWPHMTAVEGSGIINGGMEYPMMTLMGDYNAAGDDALYYVTAHELAHMWIPMITGVNERRYSWMDEGFATYSENQARLARFPDVNASLIEQQAYLQTARIGLEGEIMRWSDFHYTPAAYLTASYPKPATLLVALRGILGEEMFLRAYRSFIQTWAYKHPYPYDFFNTFERISGRDLDWFWQSWYFETWTLDQAITDVRTEGDTTYITVEDQGFAPMPVHLTVTLENGETIHREEPVDLWLGGATETTISLPVASPVQRVEIDSERLFPDIDRSDNVWTP